MKPGQKDEREGRAPNFIFGWSPSHIKAFQITADRVLTGKDKGNASELARKVLSQFMFSILGPKEVIDLGIMDRWEKEVPGPTILEYAIDQYKQHRGRLLDRSVSDTAVDAEEQSEKAIVKSLQSRKRNLTKAS